MCVLYVRVSCFVVRGCAVSRRYIDVCNCDMFSVVNMYLDQLKFYVMCINSLEGIYVVVNAMLSLMSVMRPPPALCSRCCMLVSCVHPVAILSAVFCIICSLSMLVSDA